MLKFFSQNDRLIKSESLLGPNAFLPGFFSILGLFFKRSLCPTRPHDMHDARKITRQKLTLSVKALSQRGKQAQSHLTQVFEPRKLA